MKTIIMIMVLSSFSVLADDYMHIRCGDDGYMVCHIPKGNPDNKHLISVGSVNALENHVEKHGDKPGKCDNTTYEELRDTCGICDVDVDVCN